MKKKVLFMVVLLCLVVATLLCSCNFLQGDDTSNGNNGGNNTSTGGNNTDTDDTDKKDGWEVITKPDPKDVYIKFLAGFTNVAYEFSEAKVKKAKDVTGDAGAKIILNGNNFYLFVKGKYNYDNPKDKAIVAIELATESTVTEENRLVGVYLYKDELYVNIGGNKVKFSLANSNWTDIYPYEMKEYAGNDLSNIAGILASNVKTNKDITGKTRRNSNKEEFKYVIDIDLDSTLGILCKSLGDLIKDDPQGIESITEFVASLFGVTKEELLAGDIPQSDVVLEFMTSANKIAELKATANLDLSESESNLIDGDDLDLTVELLNVAVTNDYANGVKIDFVNDRTERESYYSYREAIYRATLPMKKYSNDSVVDSGYTFNLTTRVFQEDTVENFVFLEYSNNKTNVVERALYIYGDIMYIYMNGEIIHRQVLDLTDLANRVVSNDLGGTARMDIFTVISYVLKYMTITEEELRLEINETIFTDVWYNFSDVITFIDNEGDGALSKNEDAMAFVEFLRTNVAIFTLVYGEPFLSVVEEDNKIITDVTSILSAYEESIAPPVEE